MQSTRVEAYARKLKESFKRKCFDIAKIAVWPKHSQTLERNYELSLLRNILIDKNEIIFK